MKVELDRLEGDFAVLLYDGSEVVVPRSWLPVGTAEGTALVIRIEPDGESTTAGQVEASLSRLQDEDVSGEGLEL